MKRKIKMAAAGALAAVMLLSMGTTSVLAAGPGAGYGRGFVDADSDGICDYAGSACRYIDLDGDGICDNYGARQGRGFRGGRNR